MKLDRNICSNCGEKNFTDGMYNTLFSMCNKCLNTQESSKKQNILWYFLYFLILIIEYIYFITSPDLLGYFLHIVLIIFFILITNYTMKDEGANYKQKSLFFTIYTSIVVFLLIFIFVGDLFKGKYSIGEAILVILIITCYFLTIYSLMNYGTKKIFLLENTKAFQSLERNFKQEGSRSDTLESLEMQLYDIQKKIKEMHHIFCTKDEWQEIKDLESKGLVIFEQYKEEVYKINPTLEQFMGIDLEEMTK